MNRDSKDVKVTVGPTVNLNNMSIKELNVERSINKKN